MFFFVSRKAIVETYSEFGHSESTINVQDIDTYLKEHTADVTGYWAAGISVDPNVYQVMQFIAIAGAIVGVAFTARIFLLQWMKPFKDQRQSAAQ